MVLKDCRALDELEYFERDSNGKLKIADGVADKIIDFHTHIGWHFLFAKPVDQDRETDEVLTLFPQHGNPVDLDLYPSEGYTEESHKLAAKETVRPMYSTKGWASTHTARNLTNEMERTNVERAVVLAIDFPLGPLSRNSEKVLETCRRYPRLIPFVSVHPMTPGMAWKVKKHKSAGAMGMKIHPPMQMMKANHPRAIKLAKVCGQLGMPCLYHSGVSDIAPAWQSEFPAIKHFREPVEKLPDTVFILGHAGIHQYREGIELAKDYPNVYLEFSGQPAHRIKEMVEGAGPDKVLFGSDWPYYPIAMPLAKALIATEGEPELRRKLLYDNARKLLDTMGVPREVEEAV